MIGHDVVIVGGGFTGLATAAALAGQGARVVVLERAQTWDPIFRGELIHPKGVRALGQLGLADALFDAGGVEVEGFAASASDLSAPMVLPYRDGAGPGLGIDHPVMVMTMRREVGARAGVKIITGQPVTDLTRAGERITGVVSADGTAYRADLVVLADGRQSRLRAKLGLEPDITLLSYTVAFGVEGSPLPWGSRGHVFLGGPGPILAYPYGAGKVRFCIDIPLGAAKGKPAIIAYIAERYASHVPSPLREAMLLALQTRGFEGCANHSMLTQACAAPGVVLVGDAGGCAHPLTASGMTNGMNDALTLADAVGADGPTDVALEAYQRRRYDFVRMREVFTDALYEVFRGSDAGSKALQAGVFRYWRKGPKRRAASMDILSGEDVRPSAFVKEYSRVFGSSAAGVLAGVINDPALRARAKVLRSLAKTSLGRLELAVNKTARTMMNRYRLGLHQVPAVDRGVAQ